MDVREEIEKDELENIQHRFKRSYKKRKQPSKSTIKVPKPLQVLCPSQEKKVAKQSKDKQKTQGVGYLVDPSILREIEKKHRKISRGIHHISTIDNTDDGDEETETETEDDDDDYNEETEDDAMEHDDNEYNEDTEDDVENNAMDEDNDDDDDEYNEEVEEDEGDPKNRAFDKMRDSFELLDMLAQNASRAGEDDVVVSTQQTQGGRQRQVCTLSKNVEKGPKKKRGRGPTKGIIVTEPMYLEYNSLGQPCGRWRRKYGTQIGLCMRKLNILWKWKEVPEDLKKVLWEDTMSLFHIQPDKAKKEVFLSALAERFRCFKSKLVSGWITLRRERTKAKKMEKEKKNEEGEESENEVGNRKEKEHENEGGDNVEKEQNHGETEYEMATGETLGTEQAPLSMPYQIYDHITKDDWEAFVAKKTTAKEVEKREQASRNSKKRKCYHHLGPKTYDEKRKEWIEEGFYPNIITSPSATSSSTVTGVKVDRSSDWYCGVHGKDASGKRIISDPRTREIAEAVIGWKHKEMTGEFIPKGNKDALYMVLGKDHNGRVTGKGGVRLGLKKVFGNEYSATKASPRSNEARDLEAIKATLQEELEMKMKRQFTAILEHMGLPSLDDLNVISGDKLSQQDPSTPIEVSDRMPSTPIEVPDRMPSTPNEMPDSIPSPPIRDPSMPVSKEEIPCNLLLPESGVVGGELIVVAYGRAQPPRAGQRVLLLPVVGSFLSVCVKKVVGGFKDFALPVPRPECNLQNLIDAEGSLVTWPCAWVQYLDEALQKRKKAKAMDANLSKEGLQRNKEDLQTKKVSSQSTIKNKGSKAKKNKLKLQATTKNVPSEAKEKELSSQPIGKKADLQSNSVDIHRFSKGLTSQVPPKGTPLVGKRVLDSLSKDCFWLHTCISNLPDGTPIEVDLEQSQFHYMADPSTLVYKLDVRKFLSGEVLNVSIIQVYMSALFEDSIGCKSVSKFGWFCPQEIRAAHCLANQPRVKDYIGRGIIESTRVGDEFIIAPYLEDLHWILLVISPSTHTIYQFDSACEVNGRNTLIKALLNSEMKKLHGSGLRRATVPRWRSVKCAQQEKGVDSGYYVMKFMYDIVSSCTKAGDLEKVLSAPREEPFNIAEINEVRDKFARFFTNNCL